MDAYDQLYDQDALYRFDLAWQAEIGEHEFLDGAKEAAIADLMEQSEGEQ